MTRIALGVLGLLGIGYGGLLLLERPWPDVVDASIWLGGGVVTHDALLAPVVLLLAVLALRLLPEIAQAPAVVGVVVLGAVTLVAVPVLGRFGSSPGNETLLDRNYVAGWFVLAGLTAVVVAGAIMYRRARREGSADGQGAGG